MTLPPEVTPDAERAAYADVEEALRSFPLQPTPAGLAPALMAAVRSTSRARPAFRLSWIDFALSGFAALMMTLMALAAGWLAPETTARWPVITTGPLSASDLLVWGLAAAGVPLITGLLVVAGLVFRGTRLPSRCAKAARARGACQSRAAMRHTFAQAATAGLRASR